MRIDFSEPECTNCYHCRTSGIHNTEESEPSNVIGSSVTSVPVSSGPVQAHDSVAVDSTSTSSPVKALGHDSTAVVSTSTSSPVHSSSPFRFGSIPGTITSVSSGPAQSERPAFEAPVQATSGSGASATSTSSTSSPVQISSSFRFGSTPAFTISVSSGPAQSVASQRPAFEAPVQATSGSGVSATSTSSTSSPLYSSSPFGSASAFTSVSSAPTQAFGQTNIGFGAFSAPTPHSFRDSASNTYSSFSFWPTHNLGKPAFGRPNVGFGASPASGSSLFTSAFVSRPASSFSDRFGQNPASVFGAPTESVHSQFGSKSGLNSHFPGFGVGYLPGSSSNLFRPNPPNFGGGSIGAGPQPFGFNGANTMFPSSPFSPSATLSSNPNIGCHEGSSRYPGYAPTHDGQGGTLISISASRPYLHKSHDELRWEDYKQGDKGGLYASTFASRPNAAFQPPTVLPSKLARSIPTGPAYQRFAAQFPSSISPSSTTVPPINSSVQRPHETTTVSPSAPGCTACGATSSSSTSGPFTFNGATTPPSAATTPPGLFFPTTGFGPMMFGSTLAAQGTTPALQAYPVQGYILLPFAAMILQ